MNDAMRSTVCPDASFAAHTVVRFAACLFTARSLHYPHRHHAVGEAFLTGEAA